MSYPNPEYGTGPKTLPIYLTGFVICILLTVIPFYVVMYQHLSRSHTLGIIFFAAILQFMAQVLCFLRLNTQTYLGRLNVLSFFFILLVLVILVGGSLWIMINLNYNMMH